MTERAKNLDMGAEAMAQCLRAQATLPEDPGSVTGTDKVSHNRLEL